MTRQLEDCEDDLEIANEEAEELRQRVSDYERQIAQLKCAAAKSSIGTGEVQ